MSSLKRPGIWDKKATPVIQGDQLQTPSSPINKENLPSNQLNDELTNPITKELISQLTNQLTNEQTNQLNNQQANTEDYDDENFLSGLKRADNDKKMVGFHLTGDVRRALKKLKSDDYEMSEVVNQLLRKHLPKKYFE